MVMIPKSETFRLLLAPTVRKAGPELVSLLKSLHQKFTSEPGNEEHRSKLSSACNSCLNNETSRREQSSTKLSDELLGLIGISCTALDRPDSFRHAVNMVERGWTSEIWAGIGFALGRHSNFVGFNDGSVLTMYNR